MARESAARDRFVGLVLLGFSLYLLGISVWMIVAPGSFFSALGPFGPRNDHYIRDAATFQVVFGLAALGAVRYHAWRLPVLAGLALQFGLHSVNHLVDIGAARPAWIGVVDFVGLAASTLVLLALVAHAGRRTRR